MPTYDYRCPKCGKETTKINKMSENKSGAPYCCQVQSEQFITPNINKIFIGARQFDSYYCPITKKPIDSWKKRKESFAEHDLIDANDIGIADHGDKARIDKEFENTPGVVTFGSDEDMQNKINQLGK